MHRTNLLLDKELLDEVVRITGTKTYSAAVAYSLREIVRMARANDLNNFIGSGVWEGDLSEMREDSKPPKRTKKSGSR